MKKIILSANTDWFLYNFRSSLADFLRERGFKVVFVSPPGKYSSSFTENRYDWIPWELGRQTIQPWRELPSIRQLTKIYREERPDLVHHHTIKPVLYGSLVTRLLGMDNVVNSITGRGYVFLSKETRARTLKYLIARMYRLAMRHDNYALIFENNTDREYFIQQGYAPLERTWLIPGIGVDPEKFHPEPEPTSTPLVLYSGRMLWDKGVGVLVEAARILQDQLDLRVALVGEPDPGNPASISQEQLAAWQGEGLVELWGWRADMPQVYAQSNLVVLPTMYGEGVPTVLLEAASCERATVTTDMPGCSDVTLHEKTGLVVPANDPQALANAIQSLINDPERRGRMGLAGRQLVLDKFSIDQVNEATLKVYHQVLEHSLTQRG